MDKYWKHFLKLWMPLAVMWIVMAMEQPAVTAIINRLPNAEIQLAAFGYSFALALLVEGPIIQMLSAGTAVSGSKSSFKKILKIMNVLAVGTTAVHLILCIPGIFFSLAEKVYGLPKEISHPAYWTFLVMIPWAPFVGYRRLFQGVLIRHEESKKVPQVMYIRLITSVSVLLLGLWIGNIPGSVLGGIALALGVTTGMIASYVLSLKTLKSMPEETEEDTMTLKEMVKFYIPLGLTSFIVLGIRPLENFGITLGKDVIASLAIWPIISGYRFIFSSVNQSLQEIVIALMTDKTKKKIIRFVIWITSIITVLYVISLFISPMWESWFVFVSQTPQNLLSYVPKSLMLLVPFIFLTGLLALFRGIFVYEKKTKTITQGVIINSISMLALLLTLPHFFDVSGVYLISIAYSFAYLVETLFLIAKLRKEN